MNVGGILTLHNRSTRRKSRFTSFLFRTSPTLTGLVLSSTLSKKKNRLDHAASAPSSHEEHMTILSSLKLKILMSKPLDKAKLDYVNFYVWTKRYNESSVSEERVSLLHQYHRE
jgi:hypothetical protein